MTAADRRASLPSERRRIDRRATGRSGDAAAMPAADMQRRRNDRRRPEADDSRFTPDWGSAERAAADSQFLQRRVRHLAHPRQTAFQRIYRVFLGARAAIGVILVVMLACPGCSAILPGPVIVAISIGYAAWALSMWLLPRLLGRVESPQALARPQSPHWIATIGVDAVCFMALHVAAPASGFNYAALLVLPVLMAGVLTPRLMALATSAAVTLLLLCTGLARCQWR